MKPIAVSPTDSARMTGLSRGTIYKLLREGKLQGVKVGARRLISMRSIEALISDGEGAQ